MPYFKSIPFRDPWHKLLPDSMRSNVWLVSINGDEPITSDWATEHITYLKNDHVATTRFYFTKREYSPATQCEDIRNVFDQVRPIVHKPSSRKVLSLATPPPPCRTFCDVLKSSFFTTWKEAVFEQFDKNSQVFALLMPFPLENLPPDTKVLRSLLTPQTKQDEFHNNL